MLDSFDRPTDRPSGCSLPHAMSSTIRICSLSAYATLGSRINLSALSILLKELYRIDNCFDNTRVRRKYGSLESLTNSKTFFNSLSFRMNFKTSHVTRTHKLHIRIFTTGTIHIAGASDFDNTMQNAFKLVCGLVAACDARQERRNIKENDHKVRVVDNADTFGLRDVRVAMIHSIYNHNKCIDREKTAVLLRQNGRTVRYDPNLHNALNVRFRSDNGTFLIFRSGKILVTGSKCLDMCSSELEALVTCLITVTTPPLPSSSADFK